MLIGLFVFEWILAGLIIFTTCMMIHKYKGIENGLEAYMNPRAYRTRQVVDFIDRIIKKYADVEDSLKEKIDLETMIGSDLNNEKIGRFSYIAVKNVATKTKLLMWGVILLEIVIVLVDKPSSTIPTIVILTLSVLLTVGVEIFTIVQAVQEKHDVVIMMLQNYLLNIYPVEVKNNERKKESLKNNVSSFKEKQNQKEFMNKKETIGEKNEEANITKDGTKKQVNNELTAEDIAKLLGSFR